MEAFLAPHRRLMLIFVAYHPSAEEVCNLGRCLSGLPPDIGYALVANDYRAGEAIDKLAGGADLFLPLDRNLGYGRAVNKVVGAMACTPEYVVAMNTDLSWESQLFSGLLAWLDANPDVVLAVPQIVDERGRPQRLCKRHPTLLALISRRFVPDVLKPRWLRRYDDWYVMADCDQRRPLDVPYLSGCCMAMRLDAFCRVGGFDEQYFLYLEDADITRALAAIGRCVHWPLGRIWHRWGRGSHRSWWLTLVNLHSAWLYFRKWGLSWW